MEIYTIGHSTRSLEEFVNLLQVHSITQLIDIRTIPRSRHNPQYEQEALEKSLPMHGIDYEYLKVLGGLRTKVKESINTGWRNQSFRNYADYMQTNDFVDGIEQLIKMADKKRTAIMCAEAVPWRCHRSLVGDALVVRQVNVCDIISAGNVKEHTLTSFAVTDGIVITYPGDR